MLLNCTITRLCFPKLIEKKPYHILFCCQHSVENRNILKRDPIFTFVTAPQKYILNATEATFTFFSDPNTN